MQILRGAGVLLKSVWIASSSLLIVCKRLNSGELGGLFLSGAVDNFLSQVKFLQKRSTDVRGQAKNTMGR